MAILKSRSLTDSLAGLLIEKVNNTSKFNADKHAMNFFRHDFMTMN
ncbi:hypothetical protein F385_1919 [Pantoea agglomerans 299R]|nr:hypothetical protein F385_1919 [Pantoea agglomerans 299R]